MVGLILRSVFGVKGWVRSERFLMFVATELPLPWRSPHAGRTKDPSTTSTVLFDALSPRIFHSLFRLFSLRNLRAANRMNSRESSVAVSSSIKRFHRPGLSD